MIHWHEVIKAALAGAPRSRLIELAGSDHDLQAIMEHARERVRFFDKKNKQSNLFDFTYLRLLKEAQAQVDCLEASYASGE